MLFGCLNSMLWFIYLILSIYCLQLKLTQNDLKLAKISQNMSKVYFQSQELFNCLFFKFNLLVYFLHLQPQLNQSFIPNRSLFRQVPVQTDPFSDRSLFRQVSVQSGPCAVRSMFTQVPVHTGPCSHRSLFTQVQVHTGPCSHRFLFTQASARTGPC